jgi:hypothetical protein
MVVTGMGPTVVLVAALGALVGLGVWLLVDLADRTETSGDGARETPQVTSARPDRRVERLRADLAHGRPDSIAPERLHLALVEIIDDQLRSTHHLERRDDPEAASAVLGDELQQFVDDPDAAAALLRPKRLGHLLDLIERL